MEFINKLLLLSGGGQIKACTRGSTAPSDGTDWRGTGGFISNYSLKKLHWTGVYTCQRVTIRIQVCVYTHVRAPLKKLFYYVLKFANCESS